MQSMPAPPAGGGGQGLFSRCWWATCEKHQCAKPLAFCWCCGALHVCTGNLCRAAKAPANVQKQGHALKFVPTVPTAEKPVGTRRAFIHAVFPLFPVFPLKNTMVEAKAVARLRTVPVHVSRKCASVCADRAKGRLSPWVGGGQKFEMHRPETDRIGRFLCAQVLGGGGTPSLLGWGGVWSTAQAWHQSGIFEACVYPLVGAMYPHFSKMHPQMYPHVPPDSCTLKRTHADKSQPLPIGEKKKAARLWNHAALSVAGPHPNSAPEPA